MATTIEQLTQRIEGNRKAIGRAGDIFMSMIDRQLMKQLKNGNEELPDPDESRRILP